TPAPRSGLRRSSTILATLILAVAAMAVAIAPSAALAAPEAAPSWHLMSTSQPTNFAPGAVSGPAGIQPVYVVTATNVGGAPPDGSAIPIKDTLPAGVTPGSAPAWGTDSEYGSVSCSHAGQVVTCVDSSTLLPSQTMTVTIPVDVSAGAPSSVV